MLYFCRKHHEKKFSNAKETPCKVDLVGRSLEPVTCITEDNIAEILCLLYRVVHAVQKKVSHRT